MFLRILDIDECAENTFVCGVNEACINTVGSYACRCQVGYQRRSDNVCAGEKNSISPQW